MKLKFEPSQTSLSLESQLDKLALEASVLTNVITTFRETIPNFVSKLKDNLSTFCSSDAEIQSLLTSVTKEYKDLEPKLKYANFINYDKTLVSVPEGFKGQFLDYLSVLNKDQEQVYLKGQAFLKIFHSTLADFITNKDAKISNQSNLQWVETAAETREDFNNCLSKFFPAGGSSSRSYLKTIIHRFNDIPESVTAARVLDKTHVSQNLKAMHEQVQGCVDLLNSVIEYTSKNNTAEISGVSAMNIAKGAYELGKYVEFVSAYRYRVMQMIASVDKLVLQFNALLTPS